MHDWLTIVALFLGSGVGLTGLKYSHSLGKKEATIDQKAEQLAKLEKKIDERESIDELARTLDRDVKALKDAVGALSGARVTEAVTQARNESNVLHRLEAVEKGLHRVQRFFSHQYPRVQLGSSPDLTDHDKEK